MVGEGCDGTGCFFLIAKHVAAVLSKPLAVNLLSSVLEIPDLAQPGPSPKMDTAKRKRESEPDTEYTEQPQSTTRKIHKPNPTTLLEDEAIRLAPYRRESKSTSPSSDELDSPDETSSSDGCDEKEEPNSEEADATSDLDSSSDLEGDSSSEEVTRLPRIGKPSMRPPDRSSLASRLSSFIPAIEQANEELRTGEGTTGNGVSDGLEIEGDGAGEPYIEMVRSEVRRLQSES